MKKIIISTLFMLFGSLVNAQYYQKVQEAKDYIDSVIINNNSRSITPLKLNTALNKIIQALNLLDTAGAASNVTDITYAALQDSISANALKPGSNYRITDFVTRYKIFGTATDTVGSSEPLIVSAISYDQISNIAYSPAYPQDIIYYSLNDATELAPTSGSKGVITYRKSTDTNLSAYYDWRNIRWRRWAIHPAPGLYYAYDIFGGINSYQSLLSFAGSNHDITLESSVFNVVIGTGSYSIHIGKHVGALGSGVTITNDCHDITIGEGSALVNTVGSGYFGGIFIDSESQYVNIGKRSYNIAIGYSAYAIDLGLQQSDVFIEPEMNRRRLEKGFSNFEATATISGKQLSAYSTIKSAIPGLIYNTAQYCGIFNVTSGAAIDTLDILTALTTSLTFHPIEIRPASGQKILIRDKTLGITGANIDMAGNNLLIDGAKNQFAIFKKNMSNSLSTQPTDFYLLSTNVINTSSNVVGDSLLTDATMKNDSISPNTRLLGVDTSKISTKRYTDSLFAAFEGGSGTPFGYKLSTTAPTDTSVGWINTNYNILQCYPVQYHVNGSWTQVDTVGGQFYDAVGKVFSRGYPYKIVATGQSNLGGSYIGEQANPNISPYNGYYGDTIPARAVAAWNNNSNIWVVAKIRDTPFQYSSGANYLLLAAKKINERTGRSVRIVTYPQGGTGLQCWAGVPGTPPQDSACYNEFKSRVQSSGLIHPDLFIWAQSEAGITPAPTSTTYFDKWLEMVDSMIARDHLMDTTTLKILMASGNTLTNPNDLITAGNGTSGGEGALRALAATNDRTIKYVDAITFETQLSDGLHFMPKGHEEIATRLFNSIMEGQKNPSRDMMGYGSPAPYKFSSVKQKVAMGGLVAVNNSGKPYFDLGSTGNNTIYTAAEPNLSNQYAPGIEFIQASDIVRFSHYNSSTRFQLEQSRVLFNAPVVVNGSVEAYSGANPEISWNDISVARKWTYTMINGSNEMHYNYNGDDLFHFSTVGHLGIGLTGAELPDSMLRVKNGIWGERGARFSGLPSNQTYSKSLGVTSNGTLYLKDTLAVSGVYATLTGSETLTNKTITSPTLSGTLIGSGTIGGSTIINTTGAISGAAITGSGLGTFFNMNSTGYVKSAATSFVGFNNRSVFYSSADGAMEAKNWANTSYSSLQTLYHRFGSGSPEGVVTAPVGCLYSRTDGGAGTTLYVKESGTGNTGWVAK